MSNQVKVTCGVILTIRRPNGQVEQVENTRFDGVMPARHFAAMVQATKAAGKGDILSQSPMYKMVDDITPSAADKADQAAYEHQRAVERMSARGHA